jgi:hypothetical protein
MKSSSRKGKWISSLTVKECRRKILKVSKSIFPFSFKSRLNFFILNNLHIKYDLGLFLNCAKIYFREDLFEFFPFYNFFELIIICALRVVRVVILARNLDPFLAAHRQEQPLCEQRR